MTLTKNEKMRVALHAVHPLAVDAELHDAYMTEDPDFQKTMEDLKAGRQELSPVTPGTIEAPRGRTYEEYVAHCIMNIVKLHDRFVKRRGSGEESPTRGGRPNKYEGSAANHTADTAEPDKTEKEVLDSLQQMAERYQHLFQELAGANAQEGREHYDIQQLEKLRKEDPDAYDRVKDILRRAARDMLAKAAKDTEKSRGTVPWGLKGLVQAVESEPVVSWTDVFRDWLGTNITNVLQDAMLPSPALLYSDSYSPYPGQAYDSTFTVAWLTDTSGSMSDEAFSKAQSEINHVMAVNTKVKVHHIQIDTAIHSEALVDQMDVAAEPRYGYGGTRLAAAIRRFVGQPPERGDIGNNAQLLEDPPQKHELMVIYTDGYIEDLTEDRKLFDGPVMWLITTDHVPRGVDADRDTVAFVSV
jgi:hypothetical protein